MTITEAAKKMVEGEQYRFEVEFGALLAVPLNDEFQVEMLEERTTAGNETIKCLTVWWNEQNGFSEV